MNPWCCQMVETSSGGVTTATIRPRLVTVSRVNLRVANWSSRPRLLALNSDAVIVYSDAIGHPHLTGLYIMAIWVLVGPPQGILIMQTLGLVRRPVGADNPRLARRRSNVGQGRE